MPVFRKRCDKGKESHWRVGVSKNWHTDRRSLSGERKYLRYAVNYTDEYGHPCVKVFTVGREGCFTVAQEKEAEEKAIAFREQWENGLL